MLLLAFMARISAANPNAAILRGDVAPALLSVLITSGLATGFVMMVIGGETWFVSKNIELITIGGLTAAAIWVIARFVVRPPRGTSAGSGSIASH